MATRVLVSGADGQLGQSLLALSQKNAGIEFDFKSRSSLDLSSHESIKQNLNSSYSYFINAGAYTKVDQAERDANSCYKVNATAMEYIARNCPESCRIIHISTDYVYHHNPGRPLIEEDGLYPQSVYACSKKQGEDWLMETRPDSVILRSSWVYSEYGHNFVKTMLRLGSERSEISVIDDQVGCPTYAGDIAQCLIDIVDYLERKDAAKTAGGIYNYSAKGQCSWADFAEYIFQIRNFKCKVRRIDSRSYGAAALRPRWSVMSMSKIKDHYSIVTQPWQDRVRYCIGKLG